MFVGFLDQETLSLSDHKFVIVNSPYSIFGSNHELYRLGTIAKWPEYSIEYSIRNIVWIAYLNDFNIAT